MPTDYTAQYCNRSIKITWPIRHYHRFITFRVSRKRREMYIAHARLCVYLSDPCRMPTLLHGRGCNLEEW